jgi:thiamine pyrophosphate-dependent acetolactate synthase large subunit-like protein
MTGGPAAGRSGRPRPRTGILVGPGVLANLPGIRALAEAVGVAVINTWGAKGTFRWDDPFHGGTAGLQARDFELAGLTGVELILTAGLDPDEVTTRPWEPYAEVVDLPVAELGILASKWPHQPYEPFRPRLYTELAAVVQPMYADPTTPAARLHAINQALPPDGVVFAPPGLLGFWVARTWSTTVPGSVVVPASTEPGLTERLAAAAAADGRPVTLLSEEEVTIEGVDVVVFDDDLTIPQALIDVAGPVVAWTR